MWSDKYKAEDGYERDGVFANDSEELLLNRLNFCGCGQPYRALRHTLKVLEAFAIYDSTEWDSWKKYPDAYNQMIEKMGGEDAAHFYWYWLDRLNLTSHGSSVPGWFEVEGREILEELRNMERNGDLSDDAT